MIFLLFVLKEIHQHWIVYLTSFYSHILSLVQNFRYVQKFQDFFVNDISEVLFAIKV